jgi:ferritin-like metal-binding protein YciE
MSYNNELGMPLDEFVIEKLDKCFDLTWQIQDSVLKHQIQKLLHSVFDVMCQFKDD